MLEFILFLNSPEKEIVSLIKKANYKIEENTPLCLISKKFFGFLKKKGSERIDQINQIVRAKRPSIFFTSPLRLKKDLQAILDQGGIQEITICRELTKIHETVYRGDASSLINDIEDKDLKGEVTVIVNSAIDEIISDDKLIEAASILIKEGTDKRRVAKALSKVSQFSVNEIYSMIKNF